MVYLHTRWAPTSYKWSYNSYKWPCKWVTGAITLLIGVITPFITGRGPPCTLVDFYGIHVVTIHGWYGKGRKGKHRLPVPSSFRGEVSWFLGEYTTLKFTSKFAPENLPKPSKGSRIVFQSHPLCFRGCMIGDRKTWKNMKKHILRLNCYSSSHRPIWHYFPRSMKMLYLPSHENP